MKGRLKLRDYQLAGVKFLVENRAAILADCMGLGKTVQAIAAASELGFPLLIVCPAYVKRVWEDEIRKYIPSPSLRRLSGRVPSPIPSNVDIVIVNYDILDDWADMIFDWRPRVCVYDEGHVMVDSRSQRAAAARKVSATASHRWVLTGTPVTNHLKALWNLMDLIAPRAFGTWFQFSKRYASGRRENISPVKWVWKWDTPTNVEELAGRLAFYLLRRTREEVALELPPKTRQIVALGESVTGLQFHGLSGKVISDLLSDSGLSKATSAGQMIESHIEDGHRVVCFTYHRKVAEAIHKKVPGAALIHGGQSVESRQDIIDKFQSGLLPCLVATIDSCGAGISLTSADVCVFAELSYEPHKLLQAEARVHRFGQKRPTLFQYLVAPGTIDDKVLDTVVSRLDLFEQAIGSLGEGVLDEFKSAAENGNDDIFASLTRAVERSQTAGSIRAEWGYSEE